MNYKVRPVKTMTIPEYMTAVLLIGHGGLDRLELRHDAPVPKPGPGEALIRVAAPAINKICQDQT
ncbi:MAG: hypothetical protein ACR2RF_21085 [Geminicoccaceae bacterium]